MIWSALFLISIAQGLFLIALIAFRRSGNPLASRFMIALLLTMVVSNAGYIVIRTELRHYIPHIFAISFGTILLVGPLFYLYARAVLDSTFRWRPAYILHFAPFLFQQILNIPFFMASRESWGEFIDTFMAGNLSISWSVKATYALQALHLLMYLIVVFRLLHSTRMNAGETPFLIPLLGRVAWLKALGSSLALYLLTVLGLLAFVFNAGHFDPMTNYVYSLVTSCIIYFVAYKLILQPEVISPGFTQKYRAYRPFVGEDGERCLQRLTTLMNDEKVYTNPDLKLPVLAGQMGLPAYQLSKLINEKFGKSFNEYINEHRVQEFISRLNDEQYKSYSIYGLALDVGFNSKSAFNSTFKKITGKNPSELRISA